MKLRGVRFLALVLLVCPCAWALTIQAEKARIATAGKRIQGGWNLFTNGRVGDFVRFAKAGNYTVVVRAHGSPARGVWPNMTVLLDGGSRGGADVATKEPTDYTFRIEIPAGAHAIAVAFTNDALVGGEDRNLYLHRIDIRAPEGTPDPALADRKELTVAAQKQEESVVERARADIEKHRKADAVVRVVDAEGTPVANAAVAIELARHEFLFGCNIYRFGRYKTAERNEAYKRRFRELFNAATLPFYWRGYERERGKPNYGNTDTMIAWCQEHGIRMKGHPLLWGHQAGRPTWTDDKQPSPEIQKQRVTEIVRRFSGKIEFWEVVNEPSHCREVAIDQPYRWARAADPEAYLIVNDYYVMANGYPPFFKLLEKAIKDGVPFDGIGIQAHEPRTMRFPLEKVQQTLDRYATLGRELHITEFTPCSAGQPITGSHIQGKWDEAAQADYATKFYTVCFAHPAVRAVTWWDLCDDGSWLKGGGMLRADLTPKPVYTELRKLIHETWHTRLEARTDAKGEVRFRGFFGAYIVEADGRKASVSLSKAGGRELIAALR